MTLATALRRVKAALTILLCFLYLACYLPLIAIEALYFRIKGCCR
jgi:hypothetical protein